jgi:hypothetical protein
LQIVSNLRARTPGVGQPISSDIARSHSGSYVGRQNRFEARSWRRYGDWSVLGVPTLLLWLDEDLSQNCEDDSCENLY